VEQAFDAMEQALPDKLAYPLDQKSDREKQLAAQREAAQGAAAGIEIPHARGKGAEGSWATAECCLKQLTQLITEAMRQGRATASGGGNTKRAAQTLACVYEGCLEVHKLVGKANVRDAQERAKHSVDEADPPQTPPGAGACPH
jgi:hypothetical protein